MTSEQTLTKTDLDALLNLSEPSIATVSGIITNTAIIQLDEVQKRINVSGVSDQYFSQQELEFKDGAAPSKQDSNWVILGSAIAKNLSIESINQIVLIQNKEFTVIGILAEAEESNFNFSNKNSLVLISDSAALELFDTKYYSSFTVQASSEATVDTAKEIIKSTLLDTHQITDKSLIDFSIITSGELLTTINQITGLLTSLLAGIAAISLLVGGIGIMNIMLVSVTERTREIGLRKAVGASFSDIMIQFIIEAILLTLLGGVIGIGLGYIISLGAGRLLDFQGIITTNSILLAVGVSSAIGIVFGIYPAAKAARLNPIDALRYE